MKTAQAVLIHQLERLYNSIDQGITFVDAEGNIVFANAAASALLGRPIINLTKIPAGDRDYHAGDADGPLLQTAQYPAIAAIQSSSPVKDFHMGIYNPRLREHRWFSVDAYPIYDVGDAEPSLGYAVFRDITEQRNADRELRQSKLHLALAQGIANVGSAAVDFKTGKWDWSDETFRIYGVDRRDFTPSGEGLESLVHPEDWASLYANVSRARQGMEPDPVAEYRIRRPDGAERILRRIATAVKDDAGTITGIVATVQDVTDLRMAQRENKDLQKQLYHAQRLDALGTLAGGIAHDLNNTLVPIVALTEVVLLSLDSDDANRPLIELVRQGGQRASELVDQVLAFARREAIEREVIEVKSFLQQLLRLIRTSIPGSVKIVENFPGTVHINGNRGQLHQVFLNLISNAVRAIGDKPGFIYLSTVTVTDSQLADDVDKLFILISVADTGCGMSQEVQARIFEPFFTTKKVGEGLGLGLSVAHGIVLSHDGWIRVQSALGEGTRFDVFFPVTGV